MSDTQTIPADVAAHVLWSEDLGGYPAGSFTTRLLDAWRFADADNAARLAAGWPEYAAAYATLLDSDGVEKLRAIAEGR